MCFINGDTVGRKIGLEPKRVWTWPSGSEAQYRTISDQERTRLNDLGCQEREIWPDFLHDIAAAWLLVEWAMVDGQHCVIRPAKEYTRAEFLRTTEEDAQVGTGRDSNPATAITLAFCRANGIEITEKDLKLQKRT